MKKLLALTLALVSVISMTLAGCGGGGSASSPTTEPTTGKDNNIAGKTISIMGDSISTFQGASNGVAADTSNSTIRDNKKFYPRDTVKEVALNDTWWMQVIKDMGLRLLVNNSWSGSKLLKTGNGAVGAYIDRCVQLHDDTGANAGETPDIIAIALGTNDISNKETLGTADINYATLIQKNSDGTYTYATPATSLQAVAIILHKISVRYPDAEVYYLNPSHRINGNDEIIGEFNIELKKVLDHFGTYLVDIYGSAITVADFSTYIGDNSVHPNKLGMDVYTEAFKRSLVANSKYDFDYHTVTFDVGSASADYGDNKIVLDGDSLTVTLRNAANAAVTVTMGGQDITDSVYSSDTIRIRKVTADVLIHVESAAAATKNYRWEFNGTDLVCVGGDNALTKTAGTTTDGVFSKTRYTLADAVMLRHDMPWVLEWKSSGTFENSSTRTGSKLFSSVPLNDDANARFIFKSNANGIVAIGENSYNYGIALADHNIDWTATHTYRMENRIAADGSNMVYLFVDGVEIGPLNNCYKGTVLQSTSSNWLSGQDFVLPYMGTDKHTLNNAAIEYVQVWEGGISG